MSDDYDELALDPDIFIQIGPMDSVSRATDLKVCALFRCRVGQTRIPTNWYGN